MVFVGVDLHKVNSQICFQDGETGEIEDLRIKTEAGAFEKAFGKRPRCRVVIESSTESEWVARTLEAMGHEVIVADPNFEPMYATRTRKIKTDKRDAHALADAARKETYRRAHRVSDEQRHVRHLLTCRDGLVSTRTKLISTVRALTRQDGLRVPGGAAESFHVRVESLPMSEEMKMVIEPLLASIKSMTDTIRNSYDKRIAEHANNPTARRLQTVPGVGPVVSVAMLATLDDVGRFPGAREVAAYLGLVPSERSSGEKQRRGAITKRGNSRMRWLLVQSAHTLMNKRSRANEPLYVWARAVEMRRGRRVAVVALARRLARILYAIWRDEAEYSHVVLTQAAERRPAA